MKKLALLLLFVTQIGNAQNTAVLEVIKGIEFSQDTIQSVYKWVADNIRYDVAKLNQIESSKKPNSRFKSEQEYKAHLLEKVIKYKKGVCEDYSLLFHAIVQELGYASHVIEGYTKSENGKVHSKIGHTWNAVLVNNEWELYDPTWGSGSVKDGKKFIKEYSAEWYETAPEDMLKTHMPFDPIWQLQEQPMTYRAFERSVAEENKGVKYDYSALIQAHLQKDRKAQMQDKVNRSTEMGAAVSLVERWRRKTTKNVGLYGIHSQQDLLAEAQESGQRTVDLFNKYVTAKNKQFKGSKWSIPTAEGYLVEAKDEIESALNIYQGIDVEDKKAIRALGSTITRAKKLLATINTELRFLEGIK